MSYSFNSLKWLLETLFIICFLFFYYRKKILDTIKNLFNNENKFIKGILILCFGIGFILSIKYNWRIMNIDIVYWAKYGYLKDFFVITFCIINIIINGILIGVVAMLLPLIIKKIIIYLIKKLKGSLNVKILISIIGIIICIITAMIVSKWLYSKNVYTGNKNTSIQTATESLSSEYYLLNQKLSCTILIVLGVFVILHIEKVLKIQKKIFKKIFDNTDNILKGISVLGALLCVIVSIFMMLVFVILTHCKDIEILFASIIVLLSSLTSLPLYAFADILTQLKQVNKKSNE